MDQSETEIGSIGSEETALFYPSEEEQAQTQFLPELVPQILDHITIGCTLQDAAHIVRLDPKRVKSWYTDNYCNFRFAVDQHTVANKRELIKALLNGKNVTQARSAQFVLERKHSQEYGKDVKVETNTKLIENVTQIVFDTVVKYVSDKETVKLFINDIASQIALIKSNEVPKLLIPQGSN